MIVSASRRCDIPARYLDWLVTRIDAGYCLVRNPFNANSFRRVSLAPKDMDCLVLWTRDPGPLAAGAARGLEDRGVCSLVQVTLTGYPSALEPGAPHLGAALDSFLRLSEQLGSGRVVWRYDPIVIARGLEPEFHLRNFAAIAAALEGATERVTLSLVDEYAPTRSHIARAGFADPLFAVPRRRERDSKAGPPFADKTTAPPEPYSALLARLSAIAREHGMRCLSCAEPFDLSPLGIEAGACIDAGLIDRLFGTRPAAGSGAPRGPERDGGQRRDCLCAPSVDIGEYGACPAGCAYCYANRGMGRLLHPGPGDEALSPRRPSGSA